MLLIVKPICRANVAVRNGMSPQRKSMHISGLRLKMPFPRYTSFTCMVHPCEQWCAKLHGGGAAPPHVAWSVLAVLSWCNSRSKHPAVCKGLAHPKHVRWLTPKGCLYPTPINSNTTGVSCGRYTTAAVRKQRPHSQFPMDHLPHPPRRSTSSSSGTSYSKGCLTSSSALSPVPLRSSLILLSRSSGSSKANHARTTNSSHTSAME